MARNELDSNKKKSHCFRNCLITTIVLIVVICGAIFGGGYFAYEKFARPIVNISLWDMFDIIGSIGKYDEEAIVDKPFGEEDLAGFYSNLEKATYLDLPQDFRISAAVNESLNKPQPEENPQALEGEEASPAPEDKFAAVNDFTTGNSYLDGILTNTGFAFDSLKGYENGGSELVLKDTEFAAIMDEVLSNLRVPSIVAIEEQLGIRFADLLKVKQVKITGVKTLSESVLADTEEIVDPATPAPIVLDPLKKDIKISLVLCLELGENVSKIIKNSAPSVPGFVADMTAGILPKKIFIGAGVYPYSETPPEVFINEIEGKVMDNMLSAISGIMTATGSETSTDEVFGKISSMIVKTINTMESMVGELRFVESSMNLDPITAMMSIMKVNVPDPETGSRDHYITSHDFLSMLKHIYNSDIDIDILRKNDGIIDEETIMREYISSKVDKNGQPTNLVSKEAYDADIKRLANAYGITTTPEFDMTTWKPSDFATNFKEVPKHMDIIGATMNDESGTPKHIYEFTQEEMKSQVVLSDNAIGHMFNDTLKSGIGDLPFEMDVKSFEIYELDNNPDHLRARFVGAISTTKILKSISKDAVLHKLFVTSMPEFLFLEFDVRFSPDPDHGPGMIVNFVGEDQDGRDKTASVFDTLYRIMKAIDAQMGEHIKLENLLDKIQQAADDLIAELEKLGEKPGEDITPPAPEPPIEEGAVTKVGRHSLTAIELPKPTVHVTKGGLQLPTIYDMVRKASKNKVVILDPNDITQNVVLTPEMIQQALCNMYTYDSAKSIVNARLDPANESNYDVQPTIDPLGGTVTITDAYIGYQLIKNKVTEGSDVYVRGAIVDKAKGNKYVADVEQMAILSGLELDNVREAASLGENVYRGVFSDTQTESMILSIKVRDTSDYMSALPENMPDIMPSELHANIVLNIIEKEVEGVPTKVLEKVPLVNNMSKIDMAVITTIMGQDNIFDQINSMVQDQVLNIVVVPAGLLGTEAVTLDDILCNGVYKEAVDPTKGTKGTATLSVNIA